MKKMCRRFGRAFLILVLAGSLAACQTDSSRIPSTSNMPVQSTVSVTPTASAAPQLSLSQLLAKVLLNEMAFLYTDQTRSYRYQENVYLSKITDDDQNTMSPPQFAVVDMDGDGTPEVVFQRSDYRGFVVLRYLEGDIYGYEVNYRGLMNLKKDGSYLGSAGATDNWVGKMRFLGNFYDDDVRLYAVGQQAINYYLHGEPIERDTFDHLWNEYEELPDVDWHECTDDSVKQWLGHDFKLMETPALANRQSTEMQSYLDSLSSLLYFNFYPGNSATSADWEASSAHYYDGWNKAMDAIYTSCTEKLPKDDIDALAAEQQQWLEMRSQRTLTSSASFLGDMTKMRTYHLISLYFGDHFYD